MDIDFYKTGNVTFIELDGEMNADNCSEVRDMVMKALTVNRSFLINLKNVPYMVYYFIISVTYFNFCNGV